jgi:hypothetical protein
MSILSEQMGSTRPYFIILKVNVRVCKNALPVSSSECRSIRESGLTDRIYCIRDSHLTTIARIPDIIDPQ